MVLLQPGLKCFTRIRENDVYKLGAQLFFYKRLNQSDVFTSSSLFVFYRSIIKLCTLIFVQIAISISVDLHTFHFPTYACLAHSVPAVLGNVPMMNYRLCRLADRMFLVTHSIATVAPFHKIRKQTKHILWSSKIKIIFIFLTRM